MKNLIVASLLALSNNSFASDNIFDHLSTNCNNGTYQLNIEGKKSLFGSRTITVKKANLVILSEDYEETHFPYSDRLGASIMGEEQYSEILRYGYKTKPQSFHPDMDFNFRVSTNTIVIQTYSNLQPGFGGDTPSIILQLVPYKTLLTFELSTQCKITRQ